MQWFTPTEAINSEIKAALKKAASKSGGPGGNFPDIQCYLDNNCGRRIPVMIEVKGSKNKLETLDKNAGISTKQKDVQSYAVNGVLHYDTAILNNLDRCQEVIIIGVNGSIQDSDRNIRDLSYKAYYISRKTEMYQNISPV